jgi:hypothetical protein
MVITSKREKIPLSPGAFMVATCSRRGAPVAHPGTRLIRRNRTGMTLQIENLVNILFILPLFICYSMLGG